MEKALVFMYSGQGSQYYQMARELLNNNLLFREWMFKIDKIFREQGAKSIIEEIYHEKNTRDKQFTNILYSHPAIFMVEYSLTQLLLENDIIPDYVLGASLGEFTAAAVSGLLKLEEITESILKQAQLLAENCVQGCMLAIFDHVTLYQSNPLFYQNFEIAAVNYEKHFVISGSSRNIEAVTQYLKEKEIMYYQLPVAYAFHSSLIEPAQKAYQAYLSSKSFQKPVIPNISSLKGALLEKVEASYLWDVIRKPIQFQKAVHQLEQNQSFIYLDLGPYGTLANFVKNMISNQSKSQFHSIITPFSQEEKQLALIKAKYSHKTNHIERKEKKDMLTYVFPGQGSQFKGMGKGLFDEFKEFTTAADQILEYSIKELCLDDPQSKLNQTQYTQPAIYVVNALNFLKNCKITPKKPDFLAGHSLGEYNALYAAGVFTFETGLKLVKERGRLMSQAQGGGMAAIIGLTGTEIRDILEENQLTRIELANFNTPTQIVISGIKTDIEQAQTIFEAHKQVKLFIPLKTSGAFHSQYMGESRKAFASFIEPFQFNELAIPVISNLDARPYQQSDIKKNLVNQITHSVQWTDTIRYLMAFGKMEFEEIGSSGILLKMIKKIESEAEPLMMPQPGINNGTDQNRRSHKNRAGQEAIAPFSRPAQQQKEPGQDQYDHPRQKTCPELIPAQLGDPGFKKDYNLKYAYLLGSMYRGISSKEMVIKIGRAGMMGFLGTGGMQLPQIKEAILSIQNELNQGQAYGVNLLHHPTQAELEEQAVDLYLELGVTCIEASAFMLMTPALVRYRARGLKQDQSGQVIIGHKIIAKVSRPEIAHYFLNPAPERVVGKLVSENKISPLEAELLKKVPMADDICAEADSGGHTDGGVANVLIPAILKLRDEMMVKNQFQKKVRVGAAGGIGTPEAAASAFILGAEFIMTGSINHCTVEAGTSDQVKDLLQHMNVQDTDYAPAGDMFEFGAKVQVLKKGVFFPARANKLYHLYCLFNSLDEIDEKTKAQIQEKYFKKSFDQVYNDVRQFFPAKEIEKAEKNPKHKMALFFRWYFGYSTQLALSGDQAGVVDYQVHIGPCLGAFNQWLKGSSLENWRNRHVDEIALKLMFSTAGLLNQRYQNLMAGTVI